MTMVTGNHPPGQHGQSGNPPPYPAFRPGDVGRRFFARVIDGILVVIAAFFLGFVTDSLHNYWTTGLFTGLLTFVYFVLFEVTQGTTPGKKVLGLAVHGPGGAPKPTLRQSAIRNAFTVLPVLPVAGGFLAVVAMIAIAVTISSNPVRQGKHDELAGGTLVVRN